MGLLVVIISSGIMPLQQSITLVTFTGLKVRGCDIVVK